MALKVWLPLNGNLNNQGLQGNLTVTSSGTTSWDDNGKIGKALACNGSTFLTLSSVEIGETASICCWVKTTDTNAMFWVINANVFHSVNIWSNNGYLYLNKGDSAQNPFQNNNTNVPSKADGLWHHYAVVFTGTECLLYLDGEYYAKAKTYLNPTNSTNKIIRIAGGYNNTHTYDTNGTFNDFRIYDHALSIKEVKDIAKGLVLHHKLDDIINTNLLSATPKSYNATAYNAYQLQLSENLQAGQTYTMQLWNVNVSHSGKTSSQLGLSVYWGGGSVSLQTCNGTNYFSSGHADYIKFSFTVTSSQASGSGATNAWLNIYNSVGYVAGTLNMSIGAWKLEKGNIATSLLGDATKSYDCSGYGNDGTIISSLTLSSDSPRYNNSVVFDGTTGGILIENLNIGNIINTAITYSFWIKPNGENGARSVYFGSYSGVSFSIEKTTANKLRLYWNGTPDTTTNLSITDGEWQHIVITKNGTTEMKVYLNGSLVQTITGTFNNLTFPTTFRIGRDSRSNDGTPYKGLMSDFRIYSTVLSADDVKELYNTASYLDNGYTFNAYEFNEINTNSRELNPWPADKITQKASNGGYNLLPDGSIECYSKIFLNSDYIPIGPDNKTYYYDYEYSNTSGSQFYIGIEKFDANKNTGSNSECQYQVNTTAAKNHERVTGTVTLSTANGNTAAYIRLRVLNDWSTSGTATNIGIIHYISIKEVSTLTESKINKTGVFDGDTFIEDSGFSISKTGNIIANQLIEI